MSKIRLEMFIGLHVKYWLFLSDFDESLTFWTQYSISDFMKILPVGADLLHADGWAGRSAA